MKNNAEIKYAEREIQVRNVLRYIWKRKIGILAGTIIIMVMATGIGYYADQKGYADQQKRQEHLAASENVELSETQQEQLLSLEEKKRELEAWKEYNESLLFMTFDPYAVSKVVSEYRLTGPGLEMEDITNMKAMYGNYLNANRFADAAGLANEEGEAYLLTTDVVLYEDSSIGSDFFTVTVYGADQEQAAYLSDFIQEKLNAYKKTIKKTIKDFDIVQISQTADQLLNENIYYKQKNQNTLQKSLESEYDTLTASVDQMLLDYIDGSTEQLEKPSIKGIYVGLGVFAGLGGMLILVVLEYMLSGRIKERDDLEQSAGLRCFGELDRSVNEKDIGQILENIQICGQEYEADAPIALVTAVKDETVLQPYIDKLQAGGRTWNMVGNLKKDIKKEICLRKSKTAVFIEKEDVSDFRQMIANVEKCRENEIMVLGCIYIK